MLVGCCRRGPYLALRRIIDDGLLPDQIAAQAEVSVALVEFRLKVTKLWRRAIRGVR